MPRNAAVDEFMKEYDDLYESAIDKKDELYQSIRAVRTSLDAHAALDKEHGDAHFRHDDAEGDEERDETETALAEIGLKLLKATQAVKKAVKAAEKDSAELAKYADRLARLHALNAEAIEASKREEEERLAMVEAERIRQETAERLRLEQEEEKRRKEQQEREENERKEQQRLAREKEATERKQQAQIQKEAQDRLEHARQLDKALAAAAVAAEASKERVRREEAKKRKPVPEDVAQPSEHPTNTTPKKVKISFAAYKNKTHAARPVSPEALKAVPEPHPALIVQPDPELLAKPDLEPCAKPETPDIETIENTHPKGEIPQPHDLVYLPPLDGTDNGTMMHIQTNGYDGHQFAPTSDYDSAYAVGSSCIGPTLEDTAKHLVDNHATILQQLSGTYKLPPGTQSPEEKDLLDKIDVICGYSVPKTATAQQQLEFEDYKTRMLLWKMSRSVPLTQTATINGCYGQFQRLCHKVCEDQDIAKMDITLLSTDALEKAKARKAKAKADKEAKKPIDPDMLTPVGEDDMPTYDDTQEGEPALPTPPQRKRKNGKKGKDEDDTDKHTVKHIHYVGYMVASEDLDSRVDAMIRVFDCDELNWKCPVGTCTATIKMGLVFPETVARHMTTHEDHVIRCHWCDAFRNPNDESHCDNSTDKVKKDCAMKRRYKDVHANMPEVTRAGQIRIPKNDPIIARLRIVARSFLSDDVTYSPDAYTKTVAVAIAGLVKRISAEMHASNEIIAVPGSHTLHSIVALATRTHK